MAKMKVKELDETTRQSLAAYGAIVKRETEDPLGRTSFGSWSMGSDLDGEAEVFIGRVTPVVHFTMGGAVINEKSQVLGSDLGEAIEPRALRGLWAAGEVPGGIHGDNRLGGSSLLECVVFGRIAGNEAARCLGA